MSELQTIAVWVAFCLVFGWFGAAFVALWRVFVTREPNVESREVIGSWTLLRKYLPRGVLFPFAIPNEIPARQRRR